MQNYFFPSDYQGLHKHFKYLDFTSPAACSFLLQRHLSTDFISLFNAMKCLAFDVGMRFKCSQKQFAGMLSTPNEKHAFKENVVHMAFFLEK